MAPGSIGWWQKSQTTTAGGPAAPVGEPAEEPAGGLEDPERGCVGAGSSRGVGTQPSVAQPGCGPAAVRCASCAALCELRCAVRARCASAARVLRECAAHVLRECGVSSA